MKLALASDLHFEFHNDGGDWLTARLPAADVLVCAGDLASANCLRQSLDRICSRYQHVVFVAGNHEYYGSSLEDVRKRLLSASARHSNLHVLDNGTCTVEGRRFVGTTMWFRRAPGIRAHQKALNDFSQIKHADPELYDENEWAIEFLRREVSRDDIVVTHHLPSMLSVPQEYATDALNCFFVCEVDDLIARAQPRLWLHGHTHGSCDYRIGETRVVCNPFGYAGHATNKNFSDVVIEV